MSPCFFWGQANARPCHRAREDAAQTLHKKKVNGDKSLRRQRRTRGRADVGQAVIT